MKGILGAFEALFLNRPEPVVIDRPVAAPVEENPGTSKGTILAIDDDQTVLDALRPMLRMEGFNVMTAISGSKGLDLVRYANKDVRVVLLDYNMPRLTGLDTLQHLRRLLPNIKVLGLTGIARKDLPEDFCTNVDKLMLKPYRTAELVSCINSLIDSNTPPVASHS